jgi:hypothetical protein
MLALIAQAADPGDEEEAAPGEAGALFGTAEVTGVDVSRRSGTSRATSA